MNPYSPPHNSLENGVRTYPATRKWLALIASLLASVPVGLGINVVLFEIDLVQGSNGTERTAYYWVASSLLASLFCSVVVAWIIASRLKWYHFWLTYQTGWLVYLLVGVGTVNTRIPDLIYSWGPFVVPLTVAAVAPRFSSDEKGSEEQVGAGTISEERTHEPPVI